LEQVFLNIINNSVDAIMDTGQSGTLCVKVYQDDARVCLEFHDSGPGLKDPSKIFDPFYTTKEIGKGTGLGLSICYGIVKEHGGDISAFNHVDKGAVFLVKLPIASPQNSAPPQTGN
jgi:signal transduction histidine kinase